METSAWDWSAKCSPDLLEARQKEFEESKESKFQSSEVPNRSPVRPHHARCLKWVQALPLVVWRFPMNGNSNRVYSKAA